MDIGVGLPMKALEADELAEFAHTIESGPFASLSLGDRLAYECHDVLTVLAYVAAITSRLRLSTSVLCLPLYREGVVAKQAASIDRLSKGRLSLGLGLGGRETDFAVSPAQWEGRGARFEEQLATMQRIWRGEPAFPGTGPVGPVPFTPGGLGFVEAGLAGTLTLAGVTPGDALLATLTYRLVSYWLPIPAGGVAYLIFRRRYP